MTLDPDPTLEDVASTQAGAGTVSDRLTWSAAGSKRLGQIKVATLQIYVEGKLNDRFYYSSVLGGLLAEMQISATFHLAHELRNSGEGKQKCLSYFEYLRQEDSLATVLDGKKTATAFILDKDLDDLGNQLVESPFIIYTKHYCVENHLIRESELAIAISAASGLSLTEVTRGLLNQDQWLDGCCDNWAAWVAICILAKTTGSGVANFGRSSQVNETPFGPALQDRVQEQLRHVAARCGRDIRMVEEEFLQIRQMVQERAQAGRRDELFKGKWYSRFIADYTMNLSGLGSCDEKSVWAAVAARLNPSHPGSTHFRHAVANVLKLL